MILYFSDTVCVLISSSLPALDTGLESAYGVAYPLLEFGLESSNGDANGLCKLDLLLSSPDLEGALESSPYGDANGLYWFALVLSSPACEAQLLLLEDIAEPGRDCAGLSVGESVYGRGTLELEGASNLSEVSWVLNIGRAGLFNRFLVCKPGVGGKLIELSFRIANRSPPLPEFTVMCGGLRPGPNPPGVAIVLIFPRSQSKERQSHGFVQQCSSWEKDL